MPYDLTASAVQLLIALIWFAAGFTWGALWQLRKVRKAREAEEKNLQYFKRPRSRQ